MAAAAPEYDMTVYPTHALVRSASRGGVVHQVTFPSCDCEDFINRRGVLVTLEGGVVAITLCKHIAEGLARVGGWKRPGEPEVHENLTRQRAVDLLEDSGVTRDAALAGLLRVTRGAPSHFPRSGRPAALAETSSDHGPRRYKVTIPV
jgi:hypothetical protein